MTRLSPTTLERQNLLVACPYCLAGPGDWCGVLNFGDTSRRFWPTRLLHSGRRFGAGRVGTTIARWGLSAEQVRENREEFAAAFGPTLLRQLRDEGPWTALASLASVLKLNGTVTTDVDALTAWVQQAPGPPS